MPVPRGGGPLPEPVSINANKRHDVISRNGAATKEADLEKARTHAINEALLIYSDPEYFYSDPGYLRRFLRQ